MKRYERTEELLLKGTRHYLTHVGSFGKNSDERNCTGLDRNGPLKSGGYWKKAQLEEQEQELDTEKLSTWEANQRIMKRHQRTEELTNIHHYLTHMGSFGKNSDERNWTKRWL
eukprot:gb/GECG01006270.1/.p1 GENE.gb/GECG01006270.1/~~gb/GECG01006270.1/.p1  ORF type:complete len:113 (+),score=18.28 gb/GECG01006270.1/:1-339(+)